MSADLTYITNEENKSHLERFRGRIKDTRFFDVLAWYFYSSGFHRRYPSLELTQFKKNDRRL